MKKLFSLVFTMSLLMICVSCSKKENNNKVEIEKENAIPKKLIEILNTVDKIETEILKLKIEVEKTDEVEVKKDKEKMIKKLEEDKGSESEKGEEKKGKEESKLKSVETHEEKIQKSWSSLEKEVEVAHNQLNDYKIKALEDKADEKIIKQFEENLNDLTIYVGNKDLLNSFIFNNEMYNSISYFTSLYKDYDSEILKLKYYVNDVYIYGLKNEWENTLEGIEQIDSQYSELFKSFNKEVKEKEKPTEDDKNKEKNLEKLKSSIDSLKQSLNKKDIKLLEIKKDVVISNIEKVKD